MTPPWCRVDSGEASCSHLGFFWVVHLAKKPCPTTTWSLFCGEETPTWTQRHTEITSNILTNQRKASFQKQKRERGTTSSKKKMFATKTWWSLLYFASSASLELPGLSAASLFQFPNQPPANPTGACLSCGSCTCGANHFRILFCRKSAFCVGMWLDNPFWWKNLYLLGRFFPLKNHPTKDGFWGQVTPTSFFWYLSETLLAKKRGGNSWKTLPFLSNLRQLQLSFFVSKLVGKQQHQSLEESLLGEAGEKFLWTFWIPKDFAYQNSVQWITASWWKMWTVHLQRRSELNSYNCF